MPYFNHPLSQTSRTKHELNRLCAEAVQQQIERGEAKATQLRNRRRHLRKHLLKRIPNAYRLTPRKLLHTVAMVLAMWGLGGLAVPQQAQAAAIFKDPSLSVIDVGGNAAPTLVDIDNDGDLDAVVGTSLGRVNFYRNLGTNTSPNFSAEGNLLSSPSIGLNAVTPTLVDIDGDNDLDLFIGGAFSSAAGVKSVAFYRNTGTVAAPVFTADAFNNPLASVTSPSVTDAVPAFVDIDGDGDLDVFIGEGFGTVKFYENTGSAIMPIFTAAGATDANNVTAMANPFAGVDVLSWAAPTFADIDGDGDLDALIGAGQTTGNSPSRVELYENTGSVSVPVFTAAGTTDANGRTAQANPFQHVTLGYADRVTPTLADIDNDGDLDAFIGLLDGTVRFYRNMGVATAPMFSRETNNPLDNIAMPYANLPTFSSIGNSAPAFVDIDDDGDMDLFVGDGNSNIHFYLNDGSASAPHFVSSDYNSATVPDPLSNLYSRNSNARLVFVNIDADGDLDLFVGDYSGVYFYRNTGTLPAAPVFTAGTANNLNNPLGLIGSSGSYNYVAPAFGDIDGDGDLDVLIGEKNGGVYLYRNTGTSANPVFTYDSNLFSVNAYATPTLVDIDNDGDLDVFIGESAGSLAGILLGGGGRVTFYENTGTATAPNFVQNVTGNPLKGIDVGNYSTPTFVDIDDDGDLDVFVGTAGGQVVFLENRDPAPTPVNDALQTFSGVSATTDDVTANDVFKTEGPAASFSITAFDATSIQGGTVTDNGNNTFTYTPSAGFIGNDSFTYTLDDGAGNTAVGTVNVTVAADTEAPVITLTGAVTITIAQGGSFTDPGSSVTDNVDSGLTASVTGTVDPTTVGSYTLTYNVSDAAGNAATPVTRTVNVTDQTAPVITPSANLTVEAVASNMAVTLGSASVTDNVDTGLTATADQTGPFSVGIHSIVWSATDNAGNTGTATQTVTVQDTTAPVITLVGGSTISVIQGSIFVALGTPVPDNSDNLFAIFVDPGATVTDSVDNNVSVTVAGTVDTHVVGSYTLTYAATDAFSNEATSVIRTVIVTAQATASLPGGATVQIDLPADITFNGAVTTGAVSNAPAGIVTDLGTVSFSVTVPNAGDSATVTLSFSTPLPTNAALYKVDNNVYTEIPNTQWTRVDANTIELTLTDGGSFDLDGTANGVIVDPIAVGDADVVSQPSKKSGGGSFSLWTLLMLGLTGFGSWARRYRH